ncbi:hypothetical protein BDF14DRAFT_1818829 [Spinellus fusiger]|nr:hypothetical protein BDF14DRAFT_1818829 [Spinellus fusiger]
MVAFIRPSDLEKIPFSSCIIKDSCLLFSVLAPKERHKKQAIIKPFTVHSHSNFSLCPLVCFSCLRDHSLASPPRLLGHHNLTCQTLSCQGHYYLHLVT